MSGPEPPAGLSIEGVEDVEDFIWENEGEGSVPWDRFSHVFDLVHSGNRAFRENLLESFEQAINLYSRANNIKPSDPVVLGNRCTTYLWISLYLRSQAASASEYRALNGLDPTIHAELALKDADTVLSLHTNSIRSYILKAKALVLVEKYEAARDAVLSGLQVDPFSNPLQALLRNLERTQATSMKRRDHGKPERTDDFDCTLCLKLFYEPITTPCGHSFCRSRLFQSMDHGNRCPLCRTVLFTNPTTSAVNVTLKNIIQRNFAEEYAERNFEHRSLSNFGNDFVPLFVMDVAVPCQKYHLNIFEPRYRLMVMPNPNTGSVYDFACEVEITECEPLPDGRFFIEAEGHRRFCILRSWDQDGYRVAEVEWIQDMVPHDGTEARADLQEFTNNVAEQVLSWLTMAKQAARRDQAMYEKLLGLEQMMPSVQDPERFSFWLVTLTNWRPAEKIELLRLRDSRERISCVLMYLRAEEQGRRVR